MLRPEVLRKQADFNRLYHKGKSAGSRSVVVFYKTNGLAYNRYAFLASKKVGNSVKRNRARRLMKEAFRPYRKKFEALNGLDRGSSGLDFIFIARQTINGLKCQDVEKSLRSCFSRLGLLSK